MVNPNFFLEHMQGLRVLSRPAVEGENHERQLGITHSVCLDFMVEHH